MGTAIGAAVLAVLGLGLAIGLSSRQSTPAQPVVLPAEPTATLVVASTPEGAEVTLGERKLGATPLSASDLPPGPTRIAVRQPGYLPWEREVVLPKDEVVTLTAHLEKDPHAGAAGTGYLTIETRPPADLYVGDRRVGRTPLDRAELPAGVVRIVLELDNGQRVRRAVFVPRDRETRTNIDLTTASGL